MVLSTLLNLHRENSLEGPATVSTCNYSITEYDSKTKIKHTDCIFGISGHSTLGCTHNPEGQPSFTEQELVLTHQPHLY